ncbi:MAG: type II toxin-antitoxin system VapC family toxin [Mycobacteriales bacterium]
MALLLDSTVLIDVLRGRPAGDRVRRSRSVHGVPWVCPVSIEEVYRGMRHSEEAAVTTFFDGLRIAPFGRQEAERAGAWRRDFAARGVTLAQADCLIAAAALSLNAQLATGNTKDFPMSEVAVEAWPVGL